MARAENKEVCQTREGDLPPSISVEVPIPKKKWRFSHPRAWLRNRKDPIGQQSSASNLCPYCQHALNDWFRTLPDDDYPDRDSLYFPGRHYPHHSEKPGLQLAVDVHSCRICWIFLRARIYSFDEHTAGIYRVTEAGLYIRSRRKGDTEWRLAYRSSDANDPWVEGLSIYCLNISDSAVVAAGRYLSRPTVSKRQIILSDTEKATDELSSDYRASLLSAKVWLVECSSSHIKCVGLAHHPNPTRLLYIKPGYLRLCSGTAIPLNVCYATLSHCWGLSNLFKVRRDNLSAVQKTIDIRELPQNFSRCYLHRTRAGLRVSMDRFALHHSR
jgi:hypothetical protein